MRIARLDLTRYGMFSDYSLDFGAPPGDGSDLHVVYGLNETGKSTAAAAILDLLFGIEKQSAYGVAKGRASVPNWHAYNTMRIGARLELGGRAWDVARLKRDKNSLVDSDNRPFDENLLRAELGGVDRESFHMMFSLDDKSLEQGGEAILASRGDLGQLLFSASAGLAEISGRLEALRKKADEFYRSHARKTALAEMKNALDELKDERAKADTVASAYAELVRQRDLAKKAYAAASKGLSKRRARQDEIQRLLGALPHLAALREAEKNLAPLAGLPTPPEGWDKAVSELEIEAIKLSTQRESSEAAVKKLQDELEGIADDLAALGIADRVEGWRELRSRYDSAKDIPARQGELTAKCDAVEDILRRLGREGEADPSRLLLTVRTVGALEDLIAGRSGVDSELKIAREALETARNAHAEALRELPQSDEDRDVAAIVSLKAVLAQARRDDSVSRFRTARNEIDEQTRKLSEALAALAPWRGDAETLAVISVPSEGETEELRQRLSKARELRHRHLDAWTAKTGEAERLRGEANVAARAADLVSDEAAANIRSARDAAWSAHRGSLDLSSADVFESAMRRDDAAGTARLASARELAALREREIKLAGLESDAAQAKANVEAADGAVRALNDQIAALLLVTPPASRDALSFLDAWRLRRDAALGVAGALKKAKNDARRAEEDSETARNELSRALIAAGVAHDRECALESLIEIADAAIVQEAGRETLRANVKKRREEMNLAERKLKSAREADENWRAALRDACAGSWLGEAEGEPALSAVRLSLKALDELRETLKDADDLADRIAKMERDKRRFADEVAAAAGAVGTAVGQNDVAQLADAIEGRVAGARENERRRAEKRKALEEERERLATTAKALRINIERVSTMTHLFGIDALADVAAKLKDCDRRESLRRKITEETDAVIAANVAGSFDEARTALEAVDRASLEEELGTLKAGEDGDVRSNAESFAAYREALNRLEAVGGDDVVARNEEKQRTKLEEIKDGALRYLRLKAGVAAADEALRLYRDRHRGAMMERASKAFSLISRGAYKGLTTQPSGPSEMLIALSADGGSKEAEQLSKGARFQLYLALRVAGYHELAKARVQAPFVADDIMETFDHFRAEEALKLFADMGRVGQVIYFTHHQHLAEIAQKVCPEARAHELTA